LGEASPFGIRSLPNSRAAAPPASLRPRRPVALAYHPLLKLTRSPPHPPAFGSPAPALEPKAPGAERVSERSCPVPQVAHMKTDIARCARSGRDVGEAASRAGAGAPCVPGRVGTPRPRGASIRRSGRSRRTGELPEAPPQLLAPCGWVGTGWGCNQHCAGLAGRGGANRTQFVDPDGGWCLLKLICRRRVAGCVG